MPERIVKEFAPRRGEAVLEIGPGRGVLTRGLLAAGARVLAVELDPRLAAELAEDLEGDVQIVQGDALEVDLSDLLSRRFGGAPTRVLASLPYSTGTAILERLCDLMPPLTEVAVLLQEEVVARASAPAGESAYGYLSVSVGSRCRARGGTRVRPGAFDPPPRVDSRMLWLEPLQEPLVAPPRRRAFLRMTGRLFAHRRKTLLNNLRAAGLSGEALQQAIEAARAIADPGRRPGEWGPEQLAALFHRMPAPVLAMLE